MSEDPKRCERWFCDECGADVTAPTMHTGDDHARETGHGYMGVSKREFLIQPASDPPAEHRGGEERAIWINGAKFLVHKRVMAVAELRELPLPPIPNEQVLYAETPPDQDDFGLYDEQVVDLDHTQRFFSAPRFIQPSAPDPPAEHRIEDHLERMRDLTESVDERNKRIHGSPAEEEQLTAVRGLLEQYRGYPEAQRRARALEWILSEHTRLASLAAQATTENERLSKINSGLVDDYNSQLQELSRTLTRAETAERQRDELREALERAKLLATTWRSTGERLKSRHWFTRADELDTALTDPKEQS